MAQRLESMPPSVQQAVLKAMAKEGPPAVEVPKASKYSAVRTEVDGHTFDSKAEARRYAELLRMEKAGLVRGLAMQVPYPLQVNSITIGKYIADFVYEELATTGGTQGWVTVVEDVKGVRTAVYNLKKRHMHAQYGITIRETTRKRSKKKCAT